MATRKRPSDDAITNGATARDLYDYWRSLTRPAVADPPLPASHPLSRLHVRLRGLGEPTCSRWRWNFAEWDGPPPPDLVLLVEQAERFIDQLELRDLFNHLERRAGA